MATRHGERHTTVLKVDRSYDRVRVIVRRVSCAILIAKPCRNHQSGRVHLMSAHDRLEGFTQPGIIAVSTAALKMAHEFGDHLRTEQPEKDWVVCFDWADSRSMRIPRPSGAMQELGPGFDLAAYERRHVPAEAMQSIGGVTFAIKLPSRVWLASAQRLIDADGSIGSGLVLR